MKRAIVASGGNLRLLFEMVTYAADRAAARRESEGQADPEAGPIILADLERAINQARMGFRYALGEDPLGESKVTWEQKRQRLKEIYDQLPGHDKPNDVLNDLLVGQSVQAFNGEGRYAVHPIVVDLLKDDPVFNPDKEELKGGLLS